MTSVTFTIHKGSSVVVEDVAIDRLGSELFKLGAGDYTITIMNAEGDNYTESEYTSSSFTVDKASSSVVINGVTGGVYNTTCTVVDYNVINETNVAFTISKGGYDIVSNVPIDRLDSELFKLGGGDYTITIVNYEGDNYLASEDSKSFTVYPAGSSVVIDSVADGVYKTTCTVVSFSVVNETSVTFTIRKGGSIVVENVAIDRLDSELFKLGPGDYTINIVNGANENYSSSGAEKPFSVYKASSSVTVPEVEFAYGGSKTVTVTVINSTGVITAELLNLDGTPVTVGTAEVNDRDVTVSGLAAGSYILKVTVAADDNYNSSVGNNSVVVAKVAPPALSVENIAPITYGESIVINASLTGDYNITVDGGSPVTVSGIVAGENKTVAIGKYVVGSHTVDVQFIGNQNYTESNVVSKDLTINQAVPVLTVGDIAPILYGEESISIVVNYNGDYNVTVDDGAPINLTGVVASVATPINVGKLAAGTHSVKVQFKGDENYTQSDVVEKSLTVTYFKPTPVINVASKDVTYPSDVIVTVTSNAEGIYSIRISDKSKYVYIDANTPTDVSISGLAVNEQGYRIYVSFYGSDKFNPATNSDVTVKVLHNDTPPVPKATVLNATASVTNTTAVIGITLTDVDGNKLTKVVTVMLDFEDDVDVDVVNGTGSLVLSDLAIGAYTAKVVFIGDENYTNSSASVNFEIKPVAPVETVLTATVDTDYKNAVVKITLTGKDGAKLTKLVTVKVGDSISNFTVINGEGSLALADLAFGTYTAEVNFAGDEFYANSTATTAFDIKAATVIANNIKRGVNSPYDYYATLVDANGKAIAGREITFTISGKEYKATTGADGIAKVAAGLTLLNNKETVYNVIVTNPDTLENVTATTTIVPRLIVVSGDLTADYLENPPYVVQAIGDDGNPVGANETVKVVFAGFYYDLQTNATGHVVRTIGLAPGMYAVKACYKGYNTTATVFTVKQILKVASGTLKKTATSYTLKVALKHSNGKAIANKKVFLTFKGKTYNVTTNAKGIAYKNIGSTIIKSLKAGQTYTLQARYVNDIAKGKIKVVKK